MMPKEGLTCSQVGYHCLGEKVNVKSATQHLWKGALCVVHVNALSLKTPCCYPILGPFHQDPSITFIVGSEGACGKLFILIVQLPYSSCLYWSPRTELWGPFCSFFSLCLLLEKSVVLPNR